MAICLGAFAALVLGNLFSALFPEVSHVVRIALL